MAEIKKRFFKKISGAIGDEQYRTLRNGKIIMSDKANAPTFANPQVKEDRDLRIKGFGGPNHLLPVVLDAVRVGCQGTGQASTPNTSFTKINSKTLCKGIRDEKGEMTRVYDFKQLKLSFGNIDEPVVSVTFASEQRNFTFTQEAETDDDSNTCTMKDPIYAFVLDGVKEKGKLVSLRPRGESGSTVFTVPARWDMTDLHVYVFAVYYPNQKRASPTLHVYPTE